MDWLTALSAFGAGFVVGVIVTIRLTRVIAAERDGRKGPPAP